MRAPFAWCVVALAAATGCRALEEGDRAESVKICVDDFGSQEFCACAAEEIDRTFSWVQRRTFRALRLSPNESALTNQVVKTCAAKVQLPRWPKSSLKGLRGACKGPESACDCMENSVSRQFSFAAMSAAGAAGKLQDDPQFKAAMKQAVSECPEAFFPENAPWPESAVAKMVETCQQGEGATPEYCQCLANRVSKRVKIAVIIRVGAGDEEASKQVQAVVEEIAPECLSVQPKPPPAPHKHRKQRGGK
jgi:hypothetical protein